MIADMGYESKIYIVERVEHKTNIYGEPIKNPHVGAIIVAEYDLCKMGWKNEEFYQCFNKNIDYTLWVLGCDEHGNEVGMAVDTDCYGEHLKSARIDKLISALQVCEEREHYRRIPPLIAMLESFDLREWNDDSTRLEAVHFGY